MPHCFDILMGSKSINTSYLTYPSLDPHYLSFLLPPSLSGTSHPSLSLSLSLSPPHSPSRARSPPPPLPPPPPPPSLPLSLSLSLSLCAPPLCPLRQWRCL